MSTPAPTPQSPVVTATIRTVTPLVVAGVVYALSKANIHIDNTTLDVAVNTAVAAVVGSGYKLGVGWLEAHKGSWWGRLFLIAKAPSYSPLPAPQPAPAIVVPPKPAMPLSPQPPTDGTAPTA